MMEHAGDVARIDRRVWSGRCHETLFPSLDGAPERLAETPHNHTRSIHVMLELLPYPEVPVWSSRYRRGYLGAPRRIKFDLGKPGDSMPIGLSWYSSRDTLLISTHAYIVLAANAVVDSSKNSRCVSGRSSQPRRSG